MRQLGIEEMQAGLAHIRQAPKDCGVVALIVRRPTVDEREVLTEGQLTVGDGLVGDGWRARRSTSTPDGSANPEMQLNLMGSRVVALLAQEKERWPLAGDQLFLDLDLSEENLPPGTRLALGTAVIAITAPPHLGCKKFAARFGPHAVPFVNSPEGRRLHLRGLNAKVIQPGLVRVGDAVRKLAPAPDGPASGSPG